MVDSYFTRHSLTNIGKDIMSETENKTVPCDCPCDYETAVYYANCASRPDQDPVQQELKFLPSPISNMSSGAIPDELVDVQSIRNWWNSVKATAKTEAYNMASQFAYAGFEVLQKNVVTLVSRGGRSIMDFIAPPKPPSGGGRGGNNGSNDPKSSNYRGGTAGALTYDAKPIEVRLNTGISPTVYSSLYEDGVTNFSSPMHMTLVKFGIPTDNLQVDQYFTKIISFIFTNAMQQAVSFNLDVTILTAAKIKTALNDIIYALNVYYFYNSILTFTENQNNRNDAMFDLRQNMTALDLTNLLNLKRILLGTPIPPNFISFFFYLNQSFQFQSVPGAPLHKICPVEWDNVTNYPSKTAITAALDALQTDDNKKIFTIFARCMPNWLGQTLPDIAWVPLYDPNFNTIWSNLPGYFKNSATPLRLPSFSGASNYVKYVSFTNELDGAVIALTSMWNSTMGRYEPTFVKPHFKTYAGTTAADETNRIYFSPAGTWSDSVTSATHVFQRNETNVISTNLVGNTATVHLAGSQIIQNMTNSPCNEVTLRLLDYLMSMGTIGRLPDRREYLGKAYYEQKPMKSSNSDSNGGGYKKRKK